MSARFGHNVVVRGLVTLVCASTLLVTAACGNSDDGAASSSVAGASGSGAAAEGVNSEAQATVEKNLAVPAAFQAPGPALENVAQVKGKSILYIPISLQIPAFQQVSKAMEEAAGKVGMTVSSCDGKFNPAGVAACINQAVQQKVSAVVLDQIPLGLAAQGVDQLKQAGISILVGEQEAAPGDSKLAYLATGGDRIISEMADWVAVDSKGKANVLVVAQSDSPQQRAYVDEGLIPRFKKVCPGCTTEVTDVSSAQLSQLGTQVNTLLLKNPDIDYIVSEFDANVSYILQGLKNAPNGDEVKVVSVIGDISSLQRVKNGQQVYDALGNYRWAGWALTDQVLRMLTGAKVLESATGPGRAFDKTNIDSVELSDASIENESLWGGDTYSKVYQQLWGLN
jgi:ribose transport system substrate-binding protein